jgi:myosin heavy subunit
MKKINPTEAAARAAERERVEALAAAAEENGQKVKFLFVERGGAPPAEKVLAAVLDTIEKNVSNAVALTTNHARQQERIERQSELESVVLSHEESLIEMQARFKAKLDAELKRITEVADRETKALQAESRRAAESAERAIAKLESQLEGEAKRAEAAESKCGLVMDKLSTVREAASKLRRALTSSRRKVEALEEERQRPPPSSAVPVYQEEDVEELETIIGHLTARLKEFEGNEREYARNKKAVANMEEKFRERSVLKEEVKAKDKIIEDLRKEVEDLRALKVREPRFKIARDLSLPGRPYDPYFVDVITPALINTEATPDQICTILRKIRQLKTALPPPSARVNEQLCQGWVT